MGFGPPFVAVGVVEETGNGPPFVAVGVGVAVVTVRSQAR